MKKLIPRLMIGLISMGAAAAEISDTGKPPESVIAKVGDLEISAAEIQTTLAALDDKQREAISKDPALLNQLVRSLLVQRLVVKQALEQKWDQQPEVVAQLERARLNTLSESYLRSQAEKDSEDFPSVSDLQQAYEKAKDSLLVPKQYQLAQIYIASPADATKEIQAIAKVKIDSVMKTLKAKDADFAAIARLQSEEPESAAKGGEIGWLLEKQVQSEIRDKIVMLTKGALTPALRLSDGWHIIQVVDFKNAYTPSLEEVKIQLTQQLKSERTKQVSQQYLSELLKTNPIVINEIELSKLAVPKP